MSATDIQQLLSSPAVYSAGPVLFPPKHLLAWCEAMIANRFQKPFGLLTPGKFPLYASLRANTRHNADDGSEPFDTLGV